MLLTLSAAGLLVAGWVWVLLTRRSRRIDRPLSEDWLAKHRGVSHVDGE